jgi:ornithine cyclodeaminase/alanine dehydrogenase-like protein (mu-crystallin family)
MTRADVVAELGAVVAGQVRPDPAADAVAVFDSTGTASEDVAAAGAIFERARAAGIGREIELS